MRQVDDFAIPAPEAKTSDILMDLINNRLKIPTKQQGYLDMFNGVNVIKQQGYLDMLNGVNVHQPCYYIKINLKTYVEKKFEASFAAWMKTVYPTPTHATLPPSDPSWLKKFNAAFGYPDMKGQAQLAKSMQVNYHLSVGELIWAMTTCRPDLAFASIKLSQSNSCPHELHYHALKHALKFSTSGAQVHDWNSQKVLYHPFAATNRKSSLRINSSLMPILLMLIPAPIGPLA